MSAGEGSDELCPEAATAMSVGENFNEGCTEAAMAVSVDEYLGELSTGLPAAGPARGHAGGECYVGWSSFWGILLRSGDCHD